MSKGKKKSSQKQFIKTMIITGVLGLSIMMIVMLYMIKLFGQKKAAVVAEPLTPIIGNISSEDVEVEAEEIRGVVHEIGAKRKRITIWDIEEKQHIKMSIKDKTQMTDRYGKPMSIQEIELGDIVEITYQAKQKDILTIQKSAKAWIKSELLEIDINAQSKTIKIGNTKYDYTSDLMVINDELEKIDINNINNLDTLTIKGLDNTIWSIQVVKSAGYLKLSNIPTTEGTIEIGNNIIYRLEEIEDNIPLSGGQHKIVIRMEGYKPFVKHINISTKQIEELNLEEVEEAVADLKLMVTNPGVDYKIYIDNKTYRKEEAIKVKPGQYTLKVAAEGFKTYEGEIELEEGSRRINISLQSDHESAVPEAGGQNTNQESPKADSNPSPIEEIKTVQIIIETDPADAQLFVNGVYKGKTPTLTGLKPGEYSITLEKEGYSSLYSTIIIDASNAQKGFLYTLQKE